MIVDFGKKIKELRTEANVTLQSVASATSTSATYWSDIERGNRMPVFDVLMRWAFAIELSTEQTQDIARLFLQVRCSECKHKKAVDKLCCPGKDEEEG